MGRMLARLKNTVVWAYPPDTTDDALRRHRRLARGVVHAWLFCCVALMSSVMDAVVARAPAPRPQGVLAPPPRRSRGGWLARLIAFCWANEAEAELARRGRLETRARSTEQIIGRAAMKMFFFGILIFLVLHFFTLPTASPYAAP